MAAGAQRIAEFTSSLDYDDLPDDVVRATTLHVLDALGCGLAADALALAGEGRAVMAELGEGDSSVIGLGVGLPAPNAAFANAMLCHGLDFDDTHSDSVCHITVAVAPAAIAVAEAGGLSGRELLAAIAAGTETVARIGMAASGEFHARGFHPTSVCGVFGAATAAARLGGLDAEATTRTLGIAGSMSSGLLAFLNDGTPTKPMHPAWAAHGGAIAARLGAHGAEGPPSVLDGRLGLLQAFVGERQAELAAQLDDLGTRWETLRVSYKPYPACHFMHGSLDATASLLGEVSADEIEDVLVTVPEAVVPSVLEPAGRKFEPRSDYEARFSLQYSTAAMLVHGRVNLSTYSAASLADPQVRDLARNVRYEIKPYETYPAAFPGGVRIRTKNGRVLEADFAHQLGAPENPMSEAQVREKFRENASLALDAASVDALEEAVCTLDAQDDLRAVFSHLSTPKVAA